MDLIRVFPSLFLFLEIFEKRKVATQSTMSSESDDLASRIIQDEYDPSDYEDYDYDGEDVQWSSQDTLAISLILIPLFAKMLGRKDQYSIDFSWNFL